MQNARDAFCKIPYTVEEGMQGFYDTLLDEAQNMAILPNKFNPGAILKGDTLWDVAHPHHRWGLAPKVNTVEEFIAKARAYESSTKTAMHYLGYNQNCMSCSGPLVHKYVDKAACREVMWDTSVPPKSWVILAAVKGAQHSAPIGQEVPKPTPARGRH